MGYINPQKMQFAAYGQFVLVYLEFYHFFYSIRMVCPYFGPKVLTNLYEKHTVPDFNIFKLYSMTFILN